MGCGRVELLYFGWGAKGEDGGGREGKQGGTEDVSAGALERRKGEEGYSVNKRVNVVVGGGTREKEKLKLSPLSG